MSEPSSVTREDVLPVINELDLLEHALLRFRDEFARPINPADASVHGSKLYADLVSAQERVSVLLDALNKHWQPGLPSRLDRS